MPLALLAGALLPLSHAPHGWWWLAPPALLAVLELLRRAASPGQAAGLGYLFGVGWFGHGLAWIHISVHHYGGASLSVALLVNALLVAYLAAFPALVAWLTRRLFEPERVLRFGLGFSGLWVLAEALRAHLFTGFPWLALGYGQIDAPLAGWAPLVGGEGIGALLLLSVALLAALPRVPGRPRQWLLLLPLLGAWLGGQALRDHAWTDALGEPIEVALIQGNIGQEDKWRPEVQALTLQRYADLSLGLLAEDSPPAVILWPETAVPAFLHQVEADYLRPLAGRLAEGGSRLITGVPVYRFASNEFYNALAEIGPPGAPSRYYYKRHLVPFGEYLPLRATLGGLLEFMQIPLGDFTPGAPGQPLLLPDLAPAGGSVCYEIIFPGEIAAVLPEAQWLINVSNDGWFGDSAAPWQHLEMARMRALETGRDLARATNTGVSAVIAADGRLRAHSRQFEVQRLRSEIQPRQGLTPYARSGPWPLWGLALLFAVLGLGRRRVH